MAVEAARKGNMSHYINFLITAILMFFFRFIPAPDPITPFGMAVLGIFIGLIYGWSTSKVGLSWTALLAVIALGVTTGYGTVGKSLMSLFANDMVMLTLVGMFMMGPIQKSNVGEWLVAKAMTSKLINGKPWRFSIFICVGTGIIAFLSNGMIVALFLLSIFEKMFTQAGYQKGDKYPIMMTIGIFLSLMTLNVAFPFRGWGLNCIAAFSGATGGLTLDFGKYMLVGIPFYFIVTIGYVGLMKVMGCDVSKLDNMDLSEYKAKCDHGLNKYQKTVLLIIFLWIVGSMIASFDGGDAGIRLFIRSFGVHGVVLAAVIAFFVIKVYKYGLGVFVFLLLVIAGFVIPVSNLLF